MPKEKEKMRKIYTPKGGQIEGNRSQERNANDSLRNGKGINKRILEISRF